MIRQTFGGLEFKCDRCREKTSFMTKTVLEKEGWVIPNVKLDSEGRPVEAADGSFIALGEVLCNDCAPKKVSCFNCGVTEIDACKRPGWENATFGEQKVVLCPDCVKQKATLEKFSIRLESELAEEQKAIEEKDKAHAASLTEEEKEKLISEKRAALAGKGKTRYDFECSVCKETFSFNAVMKEDAIKEFKSRGYQFEPEKVCKKCLDEKEAAVSA